MRESALMVTMMPVIHTLFPALPGTILASVLESAGCRANAKSGRTRAPVAAAERVRKSRRLVIFKPLFPHIPWRWKAAVRREFCIVGEECQSRRRARRRARWRARALLQRV